MSGFQQRQMYRDPIAVAHSQLLLAGNENATVIKADMTEPDTIFGDPELPALLDFELVDPGLVACALWRPEGRGDISDDPAMNALMYAGVGRKS